MEAAAFDIDLSLFGRIALTLVVGVCVGLIFKRLKIPAGYMIGAFVGAAILNCSTSLAFMPNGTRFFVQVVAGAFVGCSMERSDLARLRSIGKPVLVMLTAYLILMLVSGALIHVSSPLDLRTSLMCAVPGGINDTPIVAADMGADATAVTLMQLIRQVLGVAVLPVCIGYYDRVRNARGKTVERDRRAPSSTDKRIKSNQRSASSTVVALCVAVVAGTLGRASGIAGMTFAFSIVAVLILKLGFDFAYIPKWVKKACQLVAGCYLGTLLTPEGLMGLSALLAPAAILIALYTLNCMGIGWLQRKLFGYGRREGMLIMSPAGASDMALIMADMGIQNTDVVIMQVIRATVVMTIFPQIVNLVCLIAG